VQGTSRLSYTRQVQSQTNKGTPANQVHTVTVLGERSSSEERGRSAYAYGVP